MNRTFLIWALNIASVISFIQAVGISHKTYNYDLLKYSQVEAFRTYYNATENGDNYQTSSCYTTREGGLKCQVSDRINPAYSLKETLRTSELSFKALFDDNARDLEISAVFPQVYEVQSILLSLRNAEDIPALILNIYDDEDLHLQKQWVYSSSQFLCDFFFPRDAFPVERAPCEVKEDLARGIMFLMPHAITSKRVAITFFPPVIKNESSSGRMFYEVSELFLGGRCSCSDRNRPSDCIAVMEDDLARNNGSRESLVCIIDWQRVRYEALMRRKRRRQRRHRRASTVSSACFCDQSGTLYGLCDPFGGRGNQCPCKVNFDGATCNTCAKGFYGYPDCKPCACTAVGSQSAFCTTNGQCLCHPKFAGRSCNECLPDLYDFPLCQAHAESTTGKPSTDCDCFQPGTAEDSCDSNGRCRCRPNFSGTRCDECAVGYGAYPLCSACKCSEKGSLSKFCDRKSGSCLCRSGFSGLNCDVCVKSGRRFPDCAIEEECECDPAGTARTSHDALACKDRCRCKKHVSGPECKACQSSFYNLSSSNVDGCSPCNCSTEGSFGLTRECSNATGQCSCKEFVTSRACDRCKPGFYNLRRRDLFGCVACNCDIGGSVNRSCSDHGQCYCKPNVVGKRCDRLSNGNFYIPNAFHLSFEVENGMHKGLPVSFRYSYEEFANFSGRGYVAFSIVQSFVVLKLEVRQTGRYHVLLSYLLKQADSIVESIARLSNRGNQVSYSAVIEFKPSRAEHTSTSAFTFLKTRDMKKEFILRQGAWELEISSTSVELLLDYVSLIPYEYYTGSKLQPDAAEPCQVGQVSNTMCLMYKYLSVGRYAAVQASAGSNSRGVGSANVQKTRLFSNQEMLSQLTSKRMAELSKEQIALTLEIEVPDTAEYVLLVTFFNPDSNPYRLDFYDSGTSRRGFLEATPCPFVFMCRMVILDTHGVPLRLSYAKGQKAAVTFVANVRGTLAIDQVFAVPALDWSGDLVIPRLVCFSRASLCLSNAFFDTPDGVVAVKPSDLNPANPLTNSVYAVSERSVTFTCKMETTANYVFVYQFYQPNFASFPVRLTIRWGGRPVDLELQIGFCPAVGGCRGKKEVGRLVGAAIFEFSVPEGKEIWLDSMFLLPEESFTDDLLETQRRELTAKYQRSCLTSEGIPLVSPPAGFCVEALFSLTTGFLNGTSACDCDPLGAVGSTCQGLGGQCTCRENVVGRRCDRCKTGSFQFPYCQPCNCFESGSLSPDCDETGRCRCKENHTGWRCDRCAPGFWGFPECAACGCDQRGSFTVRCLSSSGQCPCLQSFGGRRCNECRVGYYNFPECRSCNCKAAGIKTSHTAPSGCYGDNPDRCDCKTNVDGAQCDQCKENFYGLDGRHPDGCLPCNCSVQGSVIGADSCGKEFGQCVCRPNVEGRRCDACKDGYYGLHEDEVLGCKPCLCNRGGSVDATCDKITGQCRCKSGVGGLRCDVPESSGYYLPSLGDLHFNADAILRREGTFYSQFNFRGVEVADDDGHFQEYFEVAEEDSFFVLVNYFLHEKNAVQLVINVSNAVEQHEVVHMLRAAVDKPSVDFVREESGNQMATFRLSPGVWTLHAKFKGRLLLSSIALTRSSLYDNLKLSHTVSNPCQIKDADGYCIMYSYFNLAHSGAYEADAESVTREPLATLDGNAFKGVNINGAIFIAPGEALKFSLPKKLTEPHYIIIQYMNLADSRTVVQVDVTGGSASVTGTAKLLPCMYAFACRQVVQLPSGVKTQFMTSSDNMTVSIKILSGKEVALVDLVSFVPTSRWTIELITPRFFCVRYKLRCMPSAFPNLPQSFNLEAETSLDVTPAGRLPPDIFNTSTKLVLLTRSERNLRWHTALPQGAYFVVFHYYQPHFASFATKVILTTYQSAHAGKVNFNFCPSMYGCRAVVTYLQDDVPERFFVSGNILRLTFSLPAQAQVWLDRITFVRPVDFNSGVLSISPVDISKRYLKRCVARTQPGPNLHTDDDFCRTSFVQLSLANNFLPLPCQCSSLGTVLPDAGVSACELDGGQCACKPGFQGRDCGQCENGVFPHCKEGGNSVVFRSI